MEEGWGIGRTFQAWRCRCRATGKMLVAGWGLACGTACSPDCTVEHGPARTELQVSREAI